MRATKIRNDLFLFYRQCNHPGIRPVLVLSVAVSPASSGLSPPMSGKAVPFRQLKFYEAPPPVGRRSRQRVGTEPERHSLSAHPGGLARKRSTEAGNSAVECGDKGLPAKGLWNPALPLSYAAMMDLGIRIWDCGFSSSISVSCSQSEIRIPKSQIAMVDRVGFEPTHPSLKRRVP